MIAANEANIVKAGTSRLTNPFVEFARHEIEQSIPRRFSQQVSRHRHKIAVKTPTHELTYDALDRLANRIAHAILARRGASAEPIALLFEQGAPACAAILGALKANKIYVPLDPAYPVPLLLSALTDAGVTLIVTGNEHIARAIDLESPQVPVLNLDALDRDSLSVDPNLDIAPDTLAYIFYTSGSTGKPKGVADTHRNVLHNVMRYTNNLHISGEDRLTLLQSPSFSATVSSLFCALLNGASVFPFNFLREGSDRLADWLIENRITIYHSVPAIFRSFLPSDRQFPDLRIIRLEGDQASKLDVALFRKHFSNTCMLVNGLGATETGIARQYFVDKEMEVTTSILPVGHPVPDVGVLIWDEMGNDLGINQVGEIVVQSRYLAAGYWKNKELSEARFLADPQGGDERIFRTGDLGLLRSDGCLDYLGRKDFRVKIRGQSVEPGEVEETLLRFPSVREAAVVARVGRLGEMELVAFLVSAREPTPGTREICDFLKEHVPGFMIPARFVFVDALALNANRKVDRRILQQMDLTSDSLAPSFSAPRSEIEAALAKIWSDVLHLPQVGLHDDFFELGGHSLLAIRVMSSIATTFKVELPLQALFEASTVAQLAEQLSDVIGRPRTGASSVTAGSTARREPRTATERRVLALWERLLDARPIGIRDSFLALQRHGDLLDRMLAEVRSAFGVFAEGFPVNAFIEEPTIEALARIIDGSIEPPSSLVVCLQPRGSLRPLFLIHAGGGYVFFYRALASRLGPDRPVYGVRAETRSDGRGRPFDRSHSIEQLAARYIAEIKTAQPKGPYSLGGACVGGVIAFEMARQLRAQGEEVACPLLLFDAFVRNDPQRDHSRILPPSRHKEDLNRRIATHLARVSQLGRVKAVRSLARKILGKIRSTGLALAGQLQWLEWTVSRRLGRPVPLELMQRRIMEGFLERSAKLQSKYMPGVWEGRIVLFKAAEGSDPEPLWTGLAQGGMVVHRMPGFHLDMMEEPFVITTAALVAEYLDRDRIPT